ncbi:hypothetical protein BH11CYA1_BH11CYA1_36260 [soil metagenome]
MYITIKIAVFNSLYAVARRLDMWCAKIATSCLVNGSINSFMAASTAADIASIYAGLHHIYDYIGQDQLVCECCQDAVARQ